MAYSKEDLERYIQATQSGYSELAHPRRNSAFFTPVHAPDFGGSVPIIAPPPSEHGGQSWLSRVSDVLMRPEYAAAGGFGELFKWAGGDNSANPARAIGQGITGKEKKTYGDVLDIMDPSNLGFNRVAGGIADLIFDPLNAVPASWIAKPLTAGAKAVSLTTKVGREAARTTKTLKDAEKVARAERGAAEAATPSPRDISAEGEMPQSQAQSIVDQVVNDTKEASKPEPVFTAPSPADTNVTEQILREEATSPVATATKPEEDFFPDEMFNPEPTAPAAASAATPGISTDTEIGNLFNQATGGGFTPEGTMQAAMDLVAKHQAKLDELMAIPNPTKEQLKEINKVQNNLEAAEQLVEKGRAHNITPTSEAKVADEVINGEVPPPTSEADITEKLLEGKTKDVDGIRQSDEMNKQVKNAWTRAKKGDFPTRQAQVMDESITNFRKQAEVSREFGNEPFVQSAAGQRYAISMDQGINALSLNGHDDAVARGLFNTAHEIGPHAFNAGIAEVLHHANNPTGLLRDEVVDSVIKAMDDATSGGYHKFHAEHGSQFVRDQWQDLHKVAQRDLAEAMVDSIDDLAHIAEQNMARYTERVGRETETLKQVTNERVEEAMKPNTSASEAAETINEVPKAQKAAADEINATPEARVNGSVAAIDSVTGAGIDAKSTAAAEKKAKAAEAGDQATVEATAKAEAKRAVEDFDEIGKKADKDYIHDVDQQNALQIEGIVERTVNWFGTKFLPNYGSKFLADFWRAKKSVNASTAARFADTLSTLSKTYSKKDLTEGWKILRDATKGKNPAGLTPEMEQLVKDLNVAAGAIYDFRGMKKTDAFYTSFMQLGIDLKKPQNWALINRALARRGVGFQFKTVKNGKKLSRTDIAKQYMDWEVENPLEFLHNSFEALRDLATNKAIMDHVVNKWGVTKPRPGYVRFVSSKGGSDLAAFMPTKTIYYIPREAADQIMGLEKIMNASTSFKGQPGLFAKFMNEVVDPMTQLWKTLVTIVRPSHHMRNMVGDMSASWIDGVYSPTPYRKAMGMLINQRQKKTFEEQIRQIQGLISPIEQKQILNPKFSVKLAGGRVEQLDDVMMHRLAYQSGILPMFTSVEDLISTSKRGLGKISQGLMDTRAVKFAGNVSEKTSHVGRLAHYNALMERSSFTSKFHSLEEASMAASRRVRQFHPDSSGLTAAEQKYMRRLFPFYSWFRQAVPTFAARLVTKPARFNDLTKVQYETAQMMGVDPASVSDPFPPDKEFPSWLRGSITGPWNQSGLMMNFGTPSETIAGLINQTPDSMQPMPGGKTKGNPQVIEQLLNMLNPAIKAPIELNAGSMVTNRPVSDTSEYWDSLIPGMGTVGRAFGSWSPSGTLMNILTGENTGGPGPIDPIKNVIDNNEDRWRNQGLTNFLIGISANNAYAPTSQKIANAERLARHNYA